MKPGIARTFLFVGLPAAAVTVGLVYVAMETQRFLTTSPRFAVHKVEILTKGAADNDELVRLAGVSPGSNIFSLDLEEIRKRVERDPWVHDATVIRELPNKIQVTYRSQQPKAILGADSMYYLNSEGVPFYRVQKGDSLAYPLVQVDGRVTDKELLRERVAASMKVLERFRSSSLYSEKDLGDITVNPDTEDGTAPFLLTLRYPPRALAGKSKQNNRLYTASLGDDDVDRQVKHWEAVVRHLVQAGKKPRLIRLELGKKVVVKLEK
jgi:cell division septal protein FtsQ